MSILKKRNISGDGKNKPLHRIYFHTETVKVRTVPNLFAFSRFFIIFILSILIFQVWQNARSL